MKEMGGLLPLISFLLIQVVVVAGGNGRTGFSLEGAIANPAEVKAYWEATLPNTPMPPAALDILGQLQGEEHKHIHRHGHGHVHFPKGARDMFFFDSVAPGSVLTTRILSTRSSSIFLLRNSSKHIPFSMKNFANIVNMFAPVSVTMANDIASTLEVCEHPQTVHGEKAGCAASIESFLDLVVSSLGTDDVRALSPGVPMEGVPSLRYIVASATPVPNSQSILACHDMPYPYKVFFCHMAMQARAYQVSLVSDDESGGVPSIDALAVCHLNTSHWDADHPFFKLMDVKPGETTACHFLGRGSIVWVPAVQEATQYIKSMYGFSRSTVSRVQLREQ